MRCWSHCAGRLTSCCVTTLTTHAPFRVRFSAWIMATVFTVFHVDLKFSALCADLIIGCLCSWRVGRASVGFLLLRSEDDSHIPSTHRTPRQDSSLRRGSIFSVHMKGTLVLLYLYTYALHQTWKTLEKRGLKSVLMHSLPLPPWILIG